MRKILILLSASLALTFPASSEITYEVQTDENSVDFSSTLSLECDTQCPVNRWTVGLSVPEFAEIQSVESHEGVVEGYEKDGRELRINTFHSQAVTEETVTVDYRVNNEAEQVFDGLYRRDISLPAFSGEGNKGVVSVNSLIAGGLTGGSEYMFEDNKLKYRGEGPQNARVVFGRGERTENFEFFPEEKDPGKAYEIATGTVGVRQKNERIPVVVLEDSRYDNELNEWSAGKFSGSVVFIRGGLEEEFTPVLAHEAVHAINDHWLGWHETDSVWFDEGTAQYVEGQVRREKLGGRRVPEVFGDEKSFTEQREDGRYEVTVPPRGDKEQLWAYYQDDMDFMKSWNKDHPERSFGYAYSELIVKKYVSDGNRLSELYQEISEFNFETDQEKWDVMSDKIDLEPCNYESRSEFNNCLERVNSYDYPIYSAVPTERAETEIEVGDQEILEQPSENESTLNESTGEVRNDQKLPSERAETGHADVQEETVFQKISSAINNFLFELTVAITG